MSHVFMGRVRKCAQCKKEFIIQTDEYAYKKYLKSFVRYFCSWSCMRKWEKNHENPAEKRERICQAIMDGLSIKEISELLDEDPRKVWYWKKKLEREVK